MSDVREDLGSCRHGHDASRRVATVAKNGKREVRCKECARLAALKRRREFADEIREKQRGYSALYHARNPSLARRFYLRRKYGITEAQFSEMLESQDGKCKICGVELTLVFSPKHRTTTTAHVDHCHETNVVRGILCMHCNAGLGHYKDDPSLMRRAVMYLELLGKIENDPTPGEPR